MRNRVSLAIATTLGLVGIVLLGVAATTALRHFHFHQYDCGSVVSAKDPRNLVSKRATVPLRLINANKQCEKLRTSRSHKATNYLIAGGAVLLVALIVPSAARIARRSRYRYG
ncbi:MAG TPA: hypothetical protein VEZ15_04070 [Acidimicrobiia bacterium]|nr:hypothetical protein [Acidimicrobiia bacterium]